MYIFFLSLVLIYNQFKTNIDLSASMYIVQYWFEQRNCLETEIIAHYSSLHGALYTKYITHGNFKDICMYLCP